MIRATPLILAALAAAPSATAQNDPPPTVEAWQQGIDAVLAQPHGITVTHARDDRKKTSLLVRPIAGSKTPRRCETEFATPVATIAANVKSERSWRIAWGSIAEVRREDTTRLELVAKKPDGVRTLLDFPSGEAAAQFAQAIDFLRQNCPG
ncbi:hypothetical protein Q9Q95_05840 [Sphingomonas sp. DG1-23]|uniref:hypothetical protein n=1 Tax=Sphingomonas sp. DG1-23 TaxID=3068316 RepID=UPI00273DB176|nr:hypothetical protein [Sphingomonas sp. DG1-23]MDP5278438.1 hypothetical protein [Sphingomonas sp. DG1-23]